MTLGMFSIVVLTLVFMSQLTYMFNSQAPTFARDLSGGFGAVVTSNPSSPISQQTLEQVPGVTASPRCRTCSPIGPDRVDKPIDWPVSGFGPELVAAPPTLQDRGKYPSDRAAWEAVRTNPKFMIADQFFATPGAGPPPTNLKVGDAVKVFDPVSGQRRTLTVAAIATDDYLTSGAYIGAGTARDLFGERA